eukprot:Platyproteum_vivax@DN7327_c0_g1_i1.p1
MVLSGDLLQTIALPQQLDNASFAETNHTSPSGFLESANPQPRARHHRLKKIVKAATTMDKDTKEASEIDTASVKEAVEVQSQMEKPKASVLKATGLKETGLKETGQKETGGDETAVMAAEAPSFTRFVEYGGVAINQDKNEAPMTFQWQKDVERGKRGSGGTVAHAVGLSLLIVALFIC